MICNFRKLQPSYFYLEVLLSKIMLILISLKPVCNYCWVLSIENEGGVNDLLNIYLKYIGSLARLISSTKQTNKSIWVH